MPMGQQERAERTILPLKAALHQEARRIGITVIAERYGHGVQGLSNNLNPSILDRQPTLHQFEDISREAVASGGGDLIRDALGRLLGCAWLPFPAVDASAGPPLLEEMSTVMDRVGRMSRDVADALADGRVDPDELAMLEKDVLRLYQACQQVIEAAKAFNQEGER